MTTYTHILDLGGGHAAGAAQVSGRSRFEKILLWLALVIKEIWFPISFIPVAVLKEFRILH